MKFMIIVKATKDSETGVMPDDKLVEAMAAYHEELAKAGILLDASGLKPTSFGWRFEYSGDSRTFVEGPFTAVKDLVAGYTLIEVTSRDEAIEWTKRYPNPAVDGGKGQIEVRRLYELEDFEPGLGIERFRKMETRHSPAGK